MEKGQLLRALTENEDERLALSRVLDQWTRSRSRNIPAVTRFLTPQEQALAEEALRRMGAAGEAVLDGGYEDAERRCALFLPDYLSFEAFREDEDYPICAVRCSFRAGERPTHRDFLGSLMGLGIRREMVGDILPGEDACDILLQREIAPFVLQNYTGAGRVSLKTAPVPLCHLHLPEKRRTEIRDTVATLRLDSVVSSAFRISRSRAADLIRAGKVDVNWRVCEKTDRLCAQGDTFSARGFGKCTLREVGGLSKKGRVTICLERYQ